MADLREEADRRYDAVLAVTGARDPRELYRERLRELRDADPDGFRQAVAYYENTLLPEVAREGSDPLAEWLEYGRYLTALGSEGEAVRIDPSGLRLPYSRPVPAEDMVLHLPNSAHKPALVVGLPTDLSPAQKATYHLLVQRRTG